MSLFSSDIDDYREPEVKGFMAKHNEMISLGMLESLEDSLAPKAGEIWKGPYKNFRNNYEFVKIIERCFHEYNDRADSVIIFIACYENGLFKSLRTGKDGLTFVRQPFYRPLGDFLTVYKKWK